MVNIETWNSSFVFFQCCFLQLLKINPHGTIHHQTKLPSRVIWPQPNQLLEWIFLLNWLCSFLTDNSMTDKCLQSNGFSLASVARCLMYCLDHQVKHLISLNLVYVCVSACSCTLFYWIRASRLMYNNCHHWDLGSQLASDRPNKLLAYPVCK